MKPNAELMTAEQAEWRWRDVRSVGLSVSFWPLEWRLGAVRWDDQFGGTIDVQVGPFGFEFAYNNGCNFARRKAP